MELTKQWRPPAITTGLILFYILLHILNLTDSLKLTPDAVFRINLNKLSFYPLVFFNTFDLILGVLFFTPLSAQFELSNGTVRTGIVLNVIAVISGLVDNILAKLSGNRIAQADYCGTTSWMLAFAAMLSVTQWSLPVIPMSSFVIGIPAWILPVIAYAAFAFTAPQFWVIHLVSLLMGFGLGAGHLGFLVDGTTSAVAWIEAKIEKGIAFLRYIVRFVGEIEARELRRSSVLNRRGSVAVDEIPMPAASLTNPVA